VLDWEFAFAGSPFFDFGNILRPPLGDLPGVAAAIATGYREAGGRLPDDWPALSRLVDLLSWADFLNRPVVDAALVADARAMIVRALRSFPA
ncbi:MAG: phosphotransferase family protein, partial [Ferrovibrionaceae bacterium]